MTTVSKISLNMCDHQMMTETILSSLEIHKLLFSLYSETKVCIPRNINDHMGLFSGKVACSKQDKHSDKFQRDHSCFYKVCSLSCARTAQFKLKNSSYLYTEHGGSRFLLHISSKLHCIPPDRTITKTHS
jgi:hypothetical protein